MEELTIEEKAKLYDEAIIRAKSFIGDTIIEESGQHIAEIIFPELKESEDEKVIRDIEVVLESSATKFFKEKGKMPIWYDRAIAWLEKQGEQKPADKVEPKFKVGDWITNGAANPAQISSIKDNMYFTHNDTVGGDIESIDKEYYLWTIQDAKVGDILFQDLMGGKTFIFDGINPEMAILYSFIINNDGEDVLPYDIGKPNTGIGHVEDGGIIYPATKEQRDLLFQKMHDAGYEWDAKKKGPKKIEQKPTDEEMKETLRTEYEKGRADVIAEIQKHTWSQ